MLFRFTSIKEYQSSLLKGEIDCTQVVQYYLDQITTHQSLNAFLEIFPDEALSRATFLDQERANGKVLGKLHGVVIGIKDVLCFEGHKVSAASKILENYTAIYSATAIEKILAEGAIIIGRQNCDEFAMGSSNENSAFGVVKNAMNYTDEVDLTFHMIAQSIEWVFDGDQYYYAKEQTTQELIEFVESLNQEQFAKIENFFDNLPKLKKTLDITCKKCGFQHHIDIEGIESFFG